MYTQSFLLFWGILPVWKDFPFYQNRALTNIDPGSGKPLSMCSHPSLSSESIKHMLDIDHVIKSHWIPGDLSTLLNDFQNRNSWLRWEQNLKNKQTKNPTTKHLKDLILKLKERLTTTAALDQAWSVITLAESMSNGKQPFPRDVLTGLRPGPIVCPARSEAQMGKPISQSSYIAKCGSDSYQRRNGGFCQGLCSWLL